ncbi:hypothetical protein ACFL5H_00830 [Candidatus Latescibacterota bacterium]
MKFILAGPHDAAKLLCFLFALLLWFHVATEQEYGDQVSLPIHYHEPTSGYILANSPPDQVKIALSGTGKNLLSFKIGLLTNPGVAYVNVTLADLRRGTHIITLNTEDITISEDASVTIVDILENAEISVLIDRKIERSLAVALDSLPPYRVEEGFVLNGKPLVTPVSITAEGPEEVLLEMRTIRISSLNTETISLADSLVEAVLDIPSPFVNVSQAIVEVRFPVERLRTKLFRGVPVTLSGFPQRFESVFLPDTLTVLIQGPESVISLSRAEDIVVEVNYSSFLEQTAGGDSLITPTIKYPNGITGASTTPVALRILRVSS